MPDPKLKEAIEEAKAILKKHDIGGIVLLSSQTHTEFWMDLEPSWSCAKSEGEHGIRIKAMRADYPNEETHKKVLADTAGLILGLADTTRLVTHQLDAVIRMMAAKFKIQHYSILEGQSTRPDTKAPLVMGNSEVTDLLVELIVDELGNKDDAEFAAKSRKFCRKLREVLNAK